VTAEDGEYGDTGDPFTDFTIDTVDRDGTWHPWISRDTFEAIEANCG